MAVLDVPDYALTSRNSSQLDRGNDVLKAGTMSTWCIHLTVQACNYKCCLIAWRKRQDATVVGSLVSCNNTPTATGTDSKQDLNLTARLASFTLETFQFSVTDSHLLYQVFIFLFKSRQPHLESMQVFTLS